MTNRRSFLKAAGVGAAATGIGLQPRPSEVKGVRYPVPWACAQKRNDDGSLTLRPTLGL